MRPELLEQDVGRNLEEAVGDEEDDESGIELDRVSAQLQVLDQAKDFGIGNVDTIWKQPKVSNQPTTLLRLLLIR